MKKNFKKLVLNKSTLSNLEKSEVNGGKETGSIICNGTTINMSCYKTGCKPDSSLCNSISHCNPCPIIK